MKQLNHKTISFLSKHIPNPTPFIEKLCFVKNKYFEWNNKHNLFSKGDAERFDERHLLDSLTPLLLGINLKTKANWLDIGSGTGFPIIPLAIVFENISFIGIEPRSKRVALLNQFRRTFELTNVKFECQHAETFKTTIEFDYTSTRAVGNLTEDWNRSSPFLKTKGRFITFKTQAELLALDLIQEAIPYSFGGDSEPYYLISIEKK